MAIKVYKFSYELQSEAYTKLNDDDFLEKAKNYIIEKNGNPDFVFPKYFRCSVIYTPTLVLPEGRSFRWRENIQRVFFDGSDSLNIASDVYSLNYKRYVYNNRDIPLEYPETQISDKFYGDDFYSLDKGISCLIDDVGNPPYIGSIVCSAIITYSDDDSSAGDEYIEPEKPKKIYLANLDFGYRRSRRKNKNRRKYRNRY